MAMLIGYARVSATHQNLDRQLATLKAARCRKIFREKLSGREGVKRPQLEKAIEALAPGECSFSPSGIGRRARCSTVSASLSGSRPARHH